MAEFARIAFGEKKLEGVTVKFTPEQEMFVRNRADQLRFDSRSSYIRSLVDKDRDNASRELNLLAESLGLKVIRETLEIPCQGEDSGVGEY